MEIPVYRIRGHHFPELAHFLYDDEISRSLDRTSNSDTYGEKFMDLESRIWMEFVQGRCAIELVCGYDKLCIESGCYKELHEWCVRGDGREDREFIRIAGLKEGKAYLFEEIRGKIHAPDWYGAKYYIAHPFSWWNEDNISQMQEIIRDIELMEKA